MNPTTSVGSSLKSALLALALIAFWAANALACPAQTLSRNSHLGARHYEPSSGRFLSADPAGQAGSMDLYSYCNGDPVNGLDPDGCLGKGALDAVGLSDSSSDAADAGYTPQPGSEGEYQGRIDNIMSAGGVTMDQAQQQIAAEDYINNSPQAQSAIAQLIPGVTLIEGITGEDLVTGQKLDGEQRFLDVNLGLIGVAGGLPSVGEGLAADEAVDMSLGTALDQNVRITQYQLNLEGDAVAAEATPAVQEAQLALPAPSVVPNAGGVIRSFVQESDQTYYRVFSGNQQGSFLTAVKPGSSSWAQQALALPPENTAAYIQEVLVPAGTRLQRSRALPAFGQQGGAEQFQLLQHIPKENFGPGVPLQ